ncbi:hypothetical protein DTO164E3_8955 [Paecilomyces variotii]|nr:hypothetical protein DTO164E3_8955 [Paecilomyces variotii]KAJ9203273.1 hypothetical protein DTO032I3_3140 [Paecilomyces variotii]KAJ9274100.1 hypothetical protein DTO021D3_9048 [Paecilomyces variotii]KAJ9287884.1 hypothetical protein DTO021C3_4494 [Paecilomyces variotii]KAJ9323256.1 hypothetical protein DTO027B3_5827 [Paecilomyces variotii]
MAETNDVEHVAEETKQEETPEQLRAQLANLTERANAREALKDYNTAAELYSQAMEIQAQLNGEMSPENADLLYAYGKSLYNVAVSKSDVLGTKVAGKAADSEPAPAQPSNKSGSKSTGQGATQKGATGETGQTKTEENRPYFQFTGDQNFDVSDSEEGEDAENEGPDEEEDDFANAFEVLDLARVLVLRKLEDVENKDSSSGKAADMPPEVKTLKERLSDIHDLQAEISLEAERFADAVSDLRAALELKESLFPFEDPTVAECHYKLSLALEFDSVHKAEDGTVSEDQSGADTEKREEAIKHMEKAIESCKVRMAKEQSKLDNGEVTDEDKVAAAKRKIGNVKEIVADMEQRLLDLRRGPVSAAQNDDLNPLNGLLGQILGQAPEQQKAKLEEAVKNANDLSSFVKKKKQPAPTSVPAPAPATTGEKRSVDADGEQPSKRAKVEESTEE